MTTRNYSLLRITLSPFCASIRIFSIHSDPEKNISFYADIYILLDDIECYLIHHLSHHLSHHSEIILKVDLT